jgi:hypothetical protein
MKSTNSITSNKAYLVDVEKREIRDIEITDWTQISLFIGDDTENFCCPITYANGDTIYADDEGIYNPVVGGAIVKMSYKRELVLVGNLVVLGTDMRTGVSQSVISTKEEIMSMIKFLSKDEAVAYTQGIATSTTDYLFN